jgi:hypothetical protein
VTAEPATVLGAVALHDQARDALGIRHPHEQLYIKALVFSPSGHGKTRFLGTANDDPRTKPMLLLDFEGGTQSLAGRRIDVMQIRSWADFTKANAYLRTKDHGYKSVGIDSVSEVQRFALMTLLDTDPNTARPDADSLVQRDYTRAHTQMRRLLRSFRDLPLHVFYTALAQDKADPRVGTVKLPLLAGVLAEEIVATMDAVMYLALTPNPETKENDRALLLHSIPGFRIKVRAPIGSDPPATLDNPTIPRLLEALTTRPKPASVSVQAPEAGAPETANSDTNRKTETA